MGQACGCTESTVTAKEEITHNEPKSKYSAPSVQNRTAGGPSGNNHYDDTANNNDYKSKTQQ